MSDWMLALVASAAGSTLGVAALLWWINRDAPRHDPPRRT